LGEVGFIYLSNFSEAILAALITWGLGTHFTTRFGSALMGEWILISLTMKMKVEKVNDWKNKTHDYIHTARHQVNTK
jgi:hypothetical protein